MSDRPSALTFLDQRRQYGAPVIGQGDDRSAALHMHRGHSNWNPFRGALRPPSPRAPLPHVHHRLAADQARELAQAHEHALAGERP